ncbi:MAG TPA: inorganic pyrophosphatase [Candidatus Binatia bacterium]|nr:inorganic pyrophosphatase [Candidatus Binatia bacterium]
MPDEDRAVADVLPFLYRRHPWHGIAIGDQAPRKVTAFIEIVPTDTVKYELDKATGHLKIDRPQKFSNVYPTLYGFLPQTYCGDETGAFCGERTGRTGIVGDGDPLDVCVLCERDISHGDILVHAIPIGGLRMIDHDQADDKIIAVLEGDAVYGNWLEIDESPSALIERLKHYFLTYKQTPGARDPRVEITHVYGREEAYEVIHRTQIDYDRKYGHLKALLAEVHGK